VETEVPLPVAAQILYAVRIAIVSGSFFEAL
jgi:hypothetical protein